MSLNRKLFSKSASDAVCNSESLEPFGNEASFNKNVAVYQFEDNADDSSGNGNNGTASGVTYVTGKFGKAASFDGTNDEITFSSGIVPAGASSISFWYNANGNTGLQYIMGNGIATASKGVTVYFSEISTGNHSFGALVAKGTSSLAGHTTGTTVYSTSSWHHVVCTWDGTASSNALKVYANGSLIAQGTSDTSSASIGTYNNFNIGGVDTTNFAAGLVDQTRIYSKVLSSEEVTTLYVDETTSTASSTTIIPGTSCLAYYPLDYDGQDKSTNYNGTETAVEFVQNGKINYSALFDGVASASGSRITIPQAIFSDGALKTFTISLWFKTGNKSATQTLISTYPYSSGTGFSLFLTTSGHLVGQFSAASGSGAPKMQYQTDMCDNAWHHAVLTYSSSGGTNDASTYLYVDGSDVTSSVVAANGWVQGSVPTWSSFTSNLVTIGMAHDSSTYSETMNGLIDEVRVFNTALSASNVTTLYGLTACTQTCTTDTAANPSTTVAYYTFDSNTDDVNGSKDINSATNLTYKAGRFGSAGYWNGSSTRINLQGTNTSILNYDADFSISLWVNCETWTTSANGIYLFSGYGTRDFLIDSQTTSGGSSGDFEARLYDGSTIYNVEYTSFQANTWYHLVFTRSTTTGMKLYVNGNLEDTNSYTGNGSDYSSTGTTNDAIGDYGYNPDPRMGFKGMIDQFRAYQSTLSASNVQDLYDTEFQCYITKDATNPFADSSEKAFYKFEENTGTSLTDSSGNGNNGTIDGMTWTSTNPAFGSYSGSFDGTNDKVDLPDNILPDNSTASSSASIWFKSGTISGGNSQGILDSWDYDTSHPAWTLFIEPDGGTGRGDGHIYLANYYLGGSAITSGSFHYDDGNWHHAVVVFDQSENKLKLYMDGSLFGTETTTESNVWIFTEKSAIGYQNAHPSHPRYFNGQADQCRVFNRALTGEEVWKLYAERNN
jgi:hypothetical protein